ncbi:unnamed protein product [Phytophthora fragariaefolia]|uniref:Unnamed protein product n=1 Tax=Phytophthora fragariaefolia TaxID=1490495 RepID=A0A9W6YEH0_9STRA|nr:unnamed protein product [Phytophthora fragariaefolia]
MNLVNCYFEWTMLGVAASVGFVTVGVVTHILRSDKNQSDCKRFSPAAIIIEGLKEVRERVTDRSGAETEGLERLRGAGYEVPPRRYDVHSDAPVINDKGPSRAPAAISAELRAAEERSILLRHQLSQHPDVHRGRRTLSRGGCPVPGHDRVVTEDRVLARAACSGAAVACVGGRRRLTESEYESVRSLSTDS